MQVGLEECSGSEERNSRGRLGAHEKGKEGQNKSDFCFQVGSASRLSREQSLCSEISTENSELDQISRLIRLQNDDDDFCSGHHIQVE